MTLCSSTMSRHNAHDPNVGPSRLAYLDHRHVWHPFTPMGQWRQSDPLIIERGEGPFLFDVKGRRFIDGVSSLWCNVHGHCVPRIDQAIREQLTKVASSVLPHRRASSLQPASARRPRAD